MIFLNILNKIINCNSRVRNFVIAVILLLLTYLVIVFLTENDKSFSEELPVSNIKNTESNNIQDVLEDELYVIQNKCENEEAYEINVYYPYTTQEQLNSYINKKIEMYIKEIKYLASRYEKEVSKGKYKLHISFDVTKGKQDYISFIFYVKQDVKYVHPNEYIFTINYDKKTNKILMQEDIENMYPNLYYNLSEYTYNELVKNEEIKNMGALDILKAGTHANKYNFMDIAFKDNSLLVIFEKYQVAPYVLGLFEVEVPLKYLENGEK